MRLLDSLATFLDEEAAVRPGDGIVVAFSGGADSTALLYGLSRAGAGLRPRRFTPLTSTTRLDAGSAQRAATAAAQPRDSASRAALNAGPVEPARRGGAGLEAEARLARYDFLEDVRSRLGFRFVATAHHRDDQAETVLLRMRFGSGPLGLASIERRRGAILRPLLDLDRAELRAALAEAGIDWIEDPTNRDGARPRNRIRLLLEPLPDDLTTRLAAIADRARAARSAVDRVAGSGARCATGIRRRIGVVVRDAEASLDTRIAGARDPSPPSRPRLPGEPSSDGRDRAADEGRRRSGLRLR